MKIISRCAEVLAIDAQNLKHDIIGVEEEKYRYEKVYTDILQMKKDTIDENKKVRIFLKEKMEVLNREKEDYTE
jgi:hypothetical protein